MSTTPGIEVETQQVVGESSDGVRLPKELPLRLAENPTLTGAYTIILRLEDDSLKVDDSRKLVYARILGYLIREGPSDQARVTVAQDVISCHTNQEKWDVGRMYFNHFIRSCMLLLLSLISHALRSS